MLKEGSMVEITSVSVNPKITGTHGSSATATGEVVPNYSFTNIGFRTNVSDNFAIGIIQEKPFGANVDYTAGAASTTYVGLKAEVDSSSTTLLTSYDMDNVTVYGGLKNQSLSASATNPLVAAYTITSTADSSLGYVLGAAIEKPEIAMRVALTYHSKVSHDLTVTESSVIGANQPSTLSFDTPEAYNLDFQTGIAANTLLFGSIRHVNWKQFLLKPDHYFATTKYLDAAKNGAPGTGKALKKYDNNTTTYSLGLGRKFNDQWSAAVTYGTEAAEGTLGGPLGPTDGFSKTGVGVTYTGEKATVTLGVQKVNNGDVGLDPIPGTMSGNTTLVTAVKIGYKF
jgi:long-subunit fatty acid transport protein